MRNMEGNYIICDETGKVCYTEREAGIVINCSKKHIYAGNNRWIKGGHANSKNIPRRKYFCKECGFYHVTHLALYDSKSLYGQWEEAFYKKYANKEIGA